GPVPGPWLLAAAPHSSAAAAAPARPIWPAVWRRRGPPRRLRSPLPCPAPRAPPHAPPPRRSPEHPALRGPRHGGRPRVDLRIRGIEAGLLDGPAIALAPVELLLLGALAPGRVDVGLGRGQGGDGEDQRAEHEQEREALRALHHGLLRKAAISNGSASSC